MASSQSRLRANGTIAHRVVYRSKGRQRVETFDTKSNAEAFLKSIKTSGLADALELLAAKDASAIEVMTVADWIDHHINLLPNVTNGTRSVYHSYNARDIRPNLIGKMPVDQLNRRTVEAWVLYLHRERHLSGKSIKNRQAILSAAMTRAVRDDIRESNPAEGVRPPTTPKLAKVYLSASEFAALRDEIPFYYRPLIGVLYGTGMRWSEATAVHVSDVDLASDPPTIHVGWSWKHHHGGKPALGPPKSEAGDRTISLPPQLVTMLARLVDGRQPDDFVFVNHQGHPVRANTFQRIWAGAVSRSEKITRKHPRIHDLRHSHASALIKLGVPLNIVQRRLGHEKISTTLDTYGHLAEDSLSVAAQAAAISLTDAFPELEP
ncbi:MAG TPA: tyrosine-type recombinase/integrase [Propionibacteriaceae bacterium]